MLFVCLIVSNITLNNMYRFWWHFLRGNQKKRFSHHQWSCNILGCDDERELEEENGTEEAGYAEETKCSVAIWALTEFQVKLGISTRKSKLYAELAIRYFASVVIISSCEKRSYVIPLGFRLIWCEYWLVHQKIPRFWASRMEPNPNRVCLTALTEIQVLQVFNKTQKVGVKCCFCVEEHHQQLV